MSDTLIVNARLVNDGRQFDGDLRISRGRIDAIGSGLAARERDTVIDAKGRLLLPGMIDDQVHLLHGHAQHQPAHPERRRAGK